MLSQGDDEFDGADDKFEESRAEENSFDTAHAEEIATRARSQRESNISGYATGMANEPEEEEEEENAEGNCKEPSMNLIGGSHGWAK